MVSLALMVHGGVENSARLERPWGPCGGGTVGRFRSAVAPFGGEWTVVACHGGGVASFVVDEWASVPVTLVVNLDAVVCHPWGVPSSVVRHPWGVPLSVVPHPWGVPLSVVPHPWGVPLSVARHPWGVPSNVVYHPLPLGDGGVAVACLVVAPPHP